MPQQNGSGAFVEELVWMPLGRDHMKIGDPNKHALQRQEKEVTVAL